MKKGELLMEIREALQREGELTETMFLRNLEEWDSLAVLAIIALYDRHFSKQIKPADISNLETIGDLIKLAGDKLEQ